MLMQADDAWPDDMPRFDRLLAQLHQQERQLTATQRWYLRLLDTHEPMANGDDAKVESALHRIIDHSGDPALVVRAQAQLIKERFRTRDYLGAYALANTVMAELPGVKDARARMSSMISLITMLDQVTVGQYSLAQTYAREMQATITSAKGQCYGRGLETQSLLYAGKLRSSSPMFDAAIDTCLASGSLSMATALRLDQASAMIDEGHAAQAMTFLQRIAPSVRQTHYIPYLASLPVTRAQAYMKLGELSKAIQSALDSLAITGAHSPLWTVQAAYKVLYEAEKKVGNAAAALDYDEKYDVLEKASLDDAKARALAYQMVRQKLEAKKLKLATLGKRNRILQLRQTLARQEQKASRLLIALLLVAIGFISLAALWLWRSQLRFRRMARHDGLTGAYNREHFFSSATRVLRRLHREGSAACLIVLDLDHFKRVNDTHGHAVGDEVLRRTVLVVRRQLGDTALLGRLGGEEFGILLPACPHERGTSVADRIRRALAATPMVIDDQVTLRVSASFGMACSARSAHTLRQLLVEADAALYRAKDGGRNQVVTEACDEATEGLRTKRERVTFTA